MRTYIHTHSTNASIIAHTHTPAQSKKQATVDLFLLGAASAAARASGESAQFKERRRCDPALTNHNNERTATRVLFPQTQIPRARAYTHTRRRGTETRTLLLLRDHHLHSLPLSQPPLLPLEDFPPLSEATLSPYSPPAREGRARGEGEALGRARAQGEEREESSTRHHHEPRARGQGAAHGVGTSGAFTAGGSRGSRA